MNNESSPWSILIADDDLSNREALTDAINDLPIDATIEFAMNGEEAAATANAKVDNQGKAYHIIFMDYQMPLMNGQEATLAIRKHEKAAQLDPARAAFIVTWSAARCKPYEGADAIITKPLILDELAPLFKEADACKNS